ncbi:MAG: thioredoxin domain-containing protein [Chloroflexi bacterium]|nr:thioredoxin domain-containing protein [Chloroflexota bacterium]
MDSNPKTPRSYGIRGIPALLLFKNGSVARQMVGALPKSSLKKNIDEGVA